MDDAHKDTNINKDAILFSSLQLPSRKLTLVNIMGRQRQNKMSVPHVTRLREGDTFPSSNISCLSSDSYLSVIDKLETN